MEVDCLVGTAVLCGRVCAVRNFIFLLPTGSPTGVPCASFSGTAGLLPRAQVLARSCSLRRSRAGYLIWKLCGVPWAIVTAGPQTCRGCSTVLLCCCAVVLCCCLFVCLCVCARMSCHQILRVGACGVSLSLSLPQCPEHFSARVMHYYSFRQSFWRRAARLSNSLPVGPRDPPRLRSLCLRKGERRAGQCTTGAVISALLLPQTGRSRWPRDMRQREDPPFPFPCTLF